MTARHPGVIYFMFLVRKFMKFGEFSATITPFGGGMVGGEEGSVLIVKILKCSTLLEFGAQSVSSLFIYSKAVLLYKPGCL